MPIGEFSQHSGLSLKRLRTYAATGLLVPAAVDSGSGYRYYSPGQLHDAQLIDTLRQAGMPLAEISTLLRHPSTERLDRWGRSVEEESAKRQSALELARRLLAGETQSLPPFEYQPSGGRSMTKLRTASRTETGPVRENNEDALVCTDRVVAVADGMGGPPGGEIASGIAVSLVGAAVMGRSPDELEAAVRAANRAIFDRASASSELEGMGATICGIALLDDGRLVIVSVGDTRAYLLQDSSVRQLTHDHTVTADLVERGDLSEEEALHHPYRGVLTRALGVGPDVELDTGTLSVAPQDRFLICTDGLFNELAPAEIMEATAEGGDPQTTADSLVDLALARGGHDNISVVVADVAV
ncbi:MAG: MerR family transcriptional regulator [Nitrososphaerales archaeon]